MTPSSSVSSAASAQAAPTKHPIERRPVAVVGAGLAGSECAWILAEHYGIPVVLHEMKPTVRTAAQHLPSGGFAELVCSNSLKSMNLANPSGLLKHEMQTLGSLVMPSALAAQVPAGEALAVDREKFSDGVTAALRKHPLVQIRSEVVTDLDSLRTGPLGCEHVVVATGPLTHGGLAEHLLERAETSKSESMLYFYDAIAPIVDGADIDRSIAFFGNRETRAERTRSKGLSGSDATAASEALEADSLEPADAVDAGDYLNLPLNRDEYFAFVERLLQGAKVPHHDFEEPRYFNACQPIEVLAASGPLTLAHGPMKGRGLTDPRTGRWPFAAVQLRREKIGHDAFNMVGFQTRLTWTAQREIFGTLPGLKAAGFHRLGSMHRNTYLCAPRLLGPNFALRTDPKIHVCGQIMGVEGYLESAAMGLLTGHLIGHQLRGRECPLPPATTAMGALARHVREADPKHYTPMNLHWGLFDPPETTLPAGKSARRQALSERAQADFARWLAHLQQG